MYIYIKLFADALRVSVEMGTIETNPISNPPHHPRTENNIASHRLTSKFSTSPSRSPQQPPRQTAHLAVTKPLHPPSPPAAPPTDQGSGSVNQEEELLATLSRHTSEIKCVRWSPTGRSGAP